MGLDEYSDFGEEFRSMDENFTGWYPDDLENCPEGCGQAVDERCINCGHQISCGYPACRHASDDIF
jgi:hypothetical protein